LVNGGPAINEHATPEVTPKQVPIAVVGLSCRLPGHCNNPHALWKFLEKGGIASNEAPSSRFNLSGHYDGSLKPNTMRSPGGMYLEDVDPQVFDAQFFNTTRVDAIAMDPQQRQLLEVVYECLENAGVTLEQISGQQVGCFVGSYAVGASPSDLLTHLLPEKGLPNNSSIDFADMQNRDPEDRAESITIGIGRAILSNRISHFLDIKGPRYVLNHVLSQ
jgi:acyl transferase domain-containing protein